MRLLSLAWGLLALAAWGAILWKLTGRALLALGGVALIAVDYHFLMQASDGRMDAMAVALGWSGVAAYLMLRERNFTLAVAVSHTLAAMAIFTHPNGVMIALILAVTTLYFDRAQGARRDRRAGRRALPRDRQRMGHCTSRRVRPISWPNSSATRRGAGPASPHRWPPCAWKSRTAIWTTSGWRHGPR